MIIGLVGCAAQKLKRPAPARDLYVSQLFRKSSAYVEQHADRWFVLSAKHGLVHPDTTLEPYNVRLGVNAGPIWTWADRVANQLREVLEGTVTDIELLVLAGEQYRTVLRKLTEYPAVVPMAGLGIGEQLGWLTRELAPQRKAG